MVGVMNLICNGARLLTEFKQDVIDLFSHKKGGNVQKWLYGDIPRPDGTTGYSLWHEFVTTYKNYYIIRREIELIPDLIARIDDDFDTIVEFGIGDDMAIDNKTVPIIKSQKKNCLYASIDQSIEELCNGLKYIETKTNIKTKGINGDFYEVHHVEGYKKLGLCLGGTITNQGMRIGDSIPIERIVKRIRTLGETVRGTADDNSLILSFDTNANLDDAQNSYNHHAWKQMQTGLMYDIQERLNPEGDFQPSMWQFEAVIDKKNHVLQQTVYPTVDQSFSIDGNEFNLRKSDRFVTINLFKFSLDLAIDMIEKAGLKYKKPPVQSDEHPVIMIEATVV